MTTLRIDSINIVDSSNIEVTFTSKLNTFLNIGNVQILSETFKTPNSEILSVKVNGNMLKIYCQPLTPYSVYNLIFRSTASSPFTSLNGDLLLEEDGIVNKHMISGPPDPQNPFRDLFKNYLRENVYNVDDSSSIVSKLIESYSGNFVKCLADVLQIKNENYVTNTIFNERKVRGVGPFDRLNEGGAYEVIRVATTPSPEVPDELGGSQLYQVSSFPGYPFSLQSISVSKEVLEIDSIDVVGKFNINNLILNVKNDQVIKLKNVTFILNSTEPTYVYPIDQFGYQLVDNRYDQDYCFRFFNIKTNQIKLNDLLLKGEIIDLQSIIRIEVDYEYKDLGRVIGNDTLSITNILVSSREAVPAIINIFDLKYAPIVDANNAIPELNGIVFSDPNSINTSASHPAFLKEIPFRLEALPYLPGQYSVDYNTGRVYVYGQDNSNNGTGDYPPVATYKYRFQYQKDLDYSFDQDLKDIAALPNGNLINNKCRINFKYEKVLIPDIDYVCKPHQESLFERVQNRLLDLGALRVLNKPVTNVFRIYNETSGEIYTPIRWNQDKVYYSYNVPPRIEEIKAERIKFNLVSNELLSVSGYLTNSFGNKVLKIYLNNNNISSKSEDCIGSSFNSSVSFSKKNIFSVERYFNKYNSNPENILQNIGDYCIDYSNGVIYCAVSQNQTNDVGVVSYNNSIIKTHLSNILSVDDIYYQINPLVQKNKNFNYLSFEESTISPLSLDFSDEGFYKNNSIYPYQLLNGELGYYDTQDESEVVTVEVNSYTNIGGNLFTNQEITYELSKSNIDPNTFVSSIPGVTFNSLDNKITIPIGTALNFSTGFSLAYNAVRLIASYSYYNFGFENKIGENIKDIRYLFENEDLINNIYPINFASASTYQERSVNVSNLSGSFYDKILQDGYGNYYLYLPIKSTYISPNITFGVQITNVNTLNNFTVDQILADGKIKLILSSTNSPAVNDLVKVDYSIQINNLSKIIIDYDKGGLYADYSRIADEIVISYEYGEDVIDFRQSKTVAPGTTYYVTYKVGAMRDALLNNFGSLLNIEELNEFNVNLERERYRDCIGGALSSFLQGPTTSAIKNVVNKITHVQPEVIESLFNSWSLGESLLHPNLIKSTGEFSLVPLKFNDGVLINQENQSIYLPQSSNLSLKEGTFETWIMPEWDGIDNNSELKISITRNGLPIANNLIFVGLNESYPKLINNTFTVNKNNCLFGAPQRNKNGVYVYYNQDPSNLFNRWYIEVIDNTSNGVKYAIQISSAGKFYDVKNLNSLNDVSTTSLTNKVTIKINNIINQSQVVTFICDKDQYLLDTADQQDKNRLSIVKDASGYLTFKVIDNSKNTYSISHDVSDWKRNEKHFVAASWKLNSENGMDRLHLFVDGFEVPNMIKYGQKTLPYPHQKFKTLNPEVIIGTSSISIVGGNDLTTTLSGEASSSISLGAYLDVQNSNILYIDDPLFDPNGYAITGINGNNIQISGSFPVALKNLKFSINKKSFNLKLDAAVYSNISVSTISSVISNNDLQTTANSSTVSSASSNFANIKPGFILNIAEAGFDNLYTILSISGSSLTLDREIDSTLSNLDFFIYSNAETELPGTRSLNPHYQVSLDGYFNSVLTVTNGVNPNDILILNTYGLNFQTIKTKHYVWSTETNKINARLPSPISTNSIKIHKILDSQYLSDGYYYNANTDQPSISDAGRDLVATIYGSGAVFTTPIKITVDGYAYDNTHVNQYVEFNDYGKLDFAQKINTINFIKVDGYGKFSFEVREKHPITYNDEGTLFAAIKCSYNLAYGSTLQRIANDSNNKVVVADYNQFFSKSIIGNTLSITSPFTENYKIIDVSNDGYFVTLDVNQTSTPSFSGASYVVRYTSDDRTGIRNGQFLFEEFNSPSVPYYLNRGTYEIEYETYLSIKTDPSSKENVYFGSDFKGANQINAVLDQVKIYTNCLQDTRIKEVIAENQRSITKDYNSLKPLSADQNTLVLIDFNSYPFINKADFYIRNLSENYIQSDNAINDYFNSSIVLKDKNFVLDNYGILDTNKEATIEFWVNPIYDTQNDPSFRYYFDAYGAKTLKVTSLNNSQIRINESVSEILSVTLENGDPAVDYFAGGNVELSNNGAIEVTFNLTGSGESITIPNDHPAVFQVISVRLEGDLLNKDYFGNGVIDKNNQRIIYLEKPISNALGKKVIVTYKPINGIGSFNTQIINLNKKLPKDNSSVIVSFIPKGFAGDRISIYKDPSGYLNFKIFTGQTATQERKMHSLSYRINWSKNTWHRVKASFRVNSKSDEMRLFIDGFEVSDQLSQARIRNNSSPKRSINLRDKINQIHIGGDFIGNNKSYCLMSNLRISNISRPVYKPYGQSIDVAYGTNLNIVFPVTKDLYTTYLLDINSSINKNDNFASIILKESNNFNFGINIFDSFGIVNQNPIIKQILEKLIKNLKPANSKAYINYS